MSKSRLLSLLIAGLYLLVLLITYLKGGFDEEPQGESIKVLLGILGWLFLSLGCIWFGDELGGMLGYLGHGRINSTTPGCLVRFMGWVLLFLPVILVLVKVL